MGTKRHPLLCALAWGTLYALVIWGVFALWPGELSPVSVGIAAAWGYWQGRRDEYVR
jgi:hypothetical protein